MSEALRNVDYGSLDRAKAAFIEAGKRTVKFASRWGFIPEESFGASANVFALDLSSFAANGRLYMTLIPEGLGTADDARPEDLTPEELKRFWRNISFKTLSALTNDAATGGMQTVLVSLYLPSSTPETVFDEPFMSGFLDGFVEGCKRVGCIYFSGETPQLKGKIVPGRLDIAGALVAILPPGAGPVNGKNLQPGNRIVFVESSGPHENGFTVLRQLAAQLPLGYRSKLPSGIEYWEAINAPSVLYTPFVQAVLASGIRPAAIESISGHGWQKLMRSSKHLRYRIRNLLPVPEVFRYVQEMSGKTTEEMLKIFNYGTGLALFVPTAEDAARAVDIAAAQGLKSVVAGEVEECSRREVVIEPWQITLSGDEFALKRG